MAQTIESVGMPPGSFEKVTPSEIESEAIISNLSPFDVPVDTGTQSFLKSIICMPIHPAAG